MVTIMSGCKKPAETATEPEATPAPNPAPATPAMVAAATPSPEPVQLATPKPELAPPGIYFLLSAVSVETSDGIVGLKPGQMLKEIKPGLYQADANQVSLRPDQVTNDLSIARRVATQDQMSQTALRQHLAAMAPPPTPTGGRPMAASPGAPVPAQEDPKIAARNALIQELNGVNQAMQQASAAIGQASARYGGNWDFAAKKSPQVFQMMQQYNALQQQAAAINAKLSSL
jgi:hypothetical protein